MLRSAIACFMLAFVGIAQAQTSISIDVVLNQPDAGGTLRLVLCADGASYASERGCVLKYGKAIGPIVHLQFPGISPGTYAVKVFHDVNDNGVLDTNWIGIPKEPYGFSNDAMGTFGPPSFEQASFKVGAGTNAVRIRMKG